MIASIDERDADRRASEPVYGLEPAEPGADHDRVMSVRHSVRPTVNNRPSGMVSAQDGAGAAEGDESGAAAPLTHYGHFERQAWRFA